MCVHYESTLEMTYIYAPLIKLVLGFIFFVDWMLNLSCTVSIYVLKIVMKHWFDNFNENNTRFGEQII